MGSGKTVISLTAAQELLEEFAVQKVLIVAPLYPVLNVWPQEIQKWDHLRFLTYQIIRGTPEERYTQVKSNAEIHIINHDLFPWLCKYIGNAWWYDMVIWDESSVLKSHSGKWYQWLKAARPYINYLVQLTGTPASNGLINVWSQVYLIDQGKALGRNITTYRNLYFDKDHSGYKYLIKPGAERKIYEKLKGVIHRLNPEDYLELPDILENDVIGEFDDKQRKQYEQFKSDYLLKIFDEHGNLKDGVEAPSMLVIVNKLIQFCNGAVYRNPKESDYDYIEVSKVKLDLLENVINEAQGEPILLAYNFRSDYIRIKERFPFVVDIHEADAIEKWNNRQLRVMAAHPKSAAHGLNLQHGGRIVCWFGLPWSMELYRQFNARLHRQGQMESVIIHRLLIRGTIDRRVATALAKKDITQQNLLNALQLEGFKNEQNVELF